MKQTALSFKPTPSYAADDFIVSDCNKLVWQWLEKWPDWPSYGAIIIGEQAAGKTHLLQCWQTKSDAKRQEILDKPNISGPIAIDDADDWTSESAQIKLFHLLNQVKEGEQSRRRKKADEERRR